MQARDKKKEKTTISKFSELERASAASFAKMIALRCVRNTSIEGIHAGQLPRSKTGDYSDVKVVTPFGEIPWNEVSRISDKEMKVFNKEVVNKLFTIFLYLDKHEMPKGPHAFHAPTDWDDAEIDSYIAQIFEHEKNK